MAAKKKINRKRSATKTITLAEASKIEKEERHRFLAFIQRQILDDIVELYESNLGKGLVAYGRITAYRDIIHAIEDETGRDHTVDFLVRIRNED